MKTIAYLILLAGFALALYGAFAVPMQYDMSRASAPQAAQVNSEAARIAAGGLAVAVLGCGLLIGVHAPEAAPKPMELPATE